MPKDKSKTFLAISYYIKGRVRIPKNMAMAINLKEGDNVLLITRGNSIVLRKVDEDALKSLAGDSK